MSRFSFTEAVDRLPSVHSSRSEDAYELLEELERAILDHRPTSAKEAVAMLDVAIPDLSSGGRIDGRDLKALMSIRTMLAAEVE